ncbi:MAG: hypothetical protein LBC75_04735 [Fibromonadaceae bacterium]|jgi:hypothetical protein|nr:hypothetical protein [Fibromonadaceae bacterium]
MKSIIALTATIALAITFTLTACEEKKKQDGADTKPPEAASEAVEAEQKTAETAETAWDKRIPAGYKLTEKVCGDLNGDGEDDCVLTIEQTKNKDSAGFMIFFKDGSDYKLVLENKPCFYMEFSGPTLSIKKGNLYFSVESSGTCSRYAYTHTFKYRNSEFELIGYDTIEDECGDWDENHVRVGGSSSKTSTNFLTKKKQSILNGKETWSKITVQDPILLRKIANGNADTNDEWQPRWK